MRDGEIEKERRATPSMSFCGRQKKALWILVLPDSKILHLFWFAYHSTTDRFW